MAITTPATYLPLAVQPFCPSQQIREGSAAGYTGELDLAENVNHLHAYLTPPIVVSVFSSNYTNAASTASTDFAAWALTTAYVMKAAWRRKVLRDFATYDLTIYYSNSGAVDPANDGSARFIIRSTGTTGDISMVAAASTAWVRGTGTLTFAPAVVGGIDTIELWMKNGTAGTCRIKSVSIKPTRLAIAAGVTTEGFVPFDSLDCSADVALSIWLRQAELLSLDVLRKTRMSTIVAWSEALDIRTLATYAAFKNATTSYVVQTIIPFRSKAGQTVIQWATLGHYTGASGTLKIQTGHMKDTGIAAITYALGAVWDPATFYAVWHDDGGSTLTCLAEKADYIEISTVAGAASVAYLMGVVAWFKDLTA